MKYLFLMLFLFSCAPSEPQKSDGYAIELKTGYPDIKCFFSAGYSSKPSCVYYPVGVKP